MSKSRLLKSLEKIAYRIDSSLKDSMNTYYKMRTHLEDLEESFEDMVDELENNLGEIDVDDANWSTLLRKVNISKNKARNFLDYFEDNIDESVLGVTGGLNKLDTLYNKDLII